MASAAAAPDAAAAAMRLDARMAAIHSRLGSLERAAELVARWGAIHTRLGTLEAATHSTPSASRQPQPGQQQQATQQQVQQQQQQRSTMPTGPPPSVTPGASLTQQRLEEELVAKGFSAAAFMRVPADYYDQPMEYRMRCLRAASVDHLCKSIVMENTKAHTSVDGWKDPRNSKYYLVLVQYSARLATDKINKFVWSMNSLGTKFYNMRLCKPEVNDQLTGFRHNAVSPVGMAEPDVPIIMSHKIAELDPPFFFMGGGEVDLKLGVPTEDFIRAYKPLIADITY